MCPDYLRKNIGARERVPGKTMAQLLFGLETEYAVAGLSPSGAIAQDVILHHLMDLARRELVFLPDHGGPGSMFLQNGSRLYTDCGAHPELCTPELTSPHDAVRYTLAGHQILANLLASVAATRLPGVEVMGFSGNVDYSGSQATWGSHENYLCRSHPDALQPQVIPHLATRLIYTGAGGFNPFSRGLEFTLSPRVAHLRQVVSGHSTGDRGIWHTKNEPLGTGYYRIHVLCGESLASQTGIFLRVGATALVVAMADAGLEPGSALQIANPLRAMQRVAGDPTCRRRLRMADGSQLTALAIQRRYLEQAESHLGAAFMPAWAPEVCRRWRAVLDLLEAAPGSVAQVLDWGIKLALYSHSAQTKDMQWDSLPFWNRVLKTLGSALVSGIEGRNNFALQLTLGPDVPIPNDAPKVEPLMRSRGLQWRDLQTVLAARERFFDIDTRFAQLGRGIFHSLDEAGVLSHRVSGVDNIEQAMIEPPAGSRATIRGQVVRRLASAGKARCGWSHIVDFPEGRILDLSDPFAQEEAWRPLEAGESRAEQGDGSFAAPWDIFVAGEGAGCLARRYRALDLYVAGDFAGAESLLRGLVREGFELPSNLTHLARVLMMMDRQAEAREQIRLAWEAHRIGPSYVPPRTLFFQCLFAMLDGAPISGFVRRIFEEIGRSGALSDWTIQPMLDHLRAPLGESHFAFLSALASVLSETSPVARLWAFPQWREAVGTSSGGESAESEPPRRRRSRGA